MLRTVWKKCLLLVALMVAGGLLSASPAEAGWGHHARGRCGWSGYGYAPAYAYTTSFCSPCVTGWGSSWYNPNWGCYSGWYSGSSWYNPNWGCYSGYYSSYDTPWYGSYGVASDCCNSVVIEPQADGGAAPTPAAPLAEDPATPAREPASVLPTPPAPTAIPPAPDANLPAPPDNPPLPPPPGDAAKPTAGIRLPASATLLTVVVPEDAQVDVNGMLTKTPGTQRQYASYGLQPGYTYTYEVRARVTRNGQTVEDVQFVRVRAGEERQVAFDFGTRPNAAIAARLR